MIPEDLITCREAARLVRTHLSTVHRWIHAGKLPAYRRGRHRYLVSRADVEALITRVVPTERIVLDAELERRHQAALEKLRKQGLRV